MSEHARHQVRNEVVVSGKTVTIVERRAPWRPDETQQWTSFPIAQLRWNPDAATWTLYWRDRNIRWHRYPGTPSARDVGMLSSTGFDGGNQAWRNIDGGTEEVPGGAAGALDPAGVGRWKKPRVAGGGLPPDR